MLNQLNVYNVCNGIMILICSNDVQLHMLAYVVFSNVFKSSIHYSVLSFVYGEVSSLDIGVGQQR